MTKNTALLLVGSMEFRRNDLNFAIRNLKSAILLGAMLLALSFPAEAQQPKKAPRIGFLSGASAENDKSRLAAFQQGLRELGYLEDKNIVIEYRHAAGKFEALPGLAAELVRLNVDVIVVSGTPAARAANLKTAKQIGLTIPQSVLYRADKVIR